VSFAPSAQAKTPPWIFSSAFREHFAEHKKLRGRPHEKMKHPASMGIPFSEIPMSC